MNILVIGGTVFLGRHLVEDALRRGHTVTLFNRGQHNPDLFPEAEKIHGDRNTDIGSLAGRTWDAVVDTCGYFPRQIRESAGLLAGSAGHYDFVSTISVYSGYSMDGMDESGPLGTIDDPDAEEMSGETYGPLKALCEREAERAMPGRVFVPRPGLIVGPEDPTGRFTYWPVRAAAGGEMLAPGSPDRQIQVIDGRDLAAWMLDAAETGTTGIFNATGPDGRLTMGELVDTCVRVSGAGATPVWVDEAFLAEHEVQAWIQMPLFVPQESNGLLTVDVSKAVGAGLRFRPLEDTVRDTLARHRDRELPAGIGLTAERERALLDAWQARV